MKRSEEDRVEPGAVDGDAGPQSRHVRTFRWWMPLAAVGSLLLIGAGVIVVLFITRENPDARPVGEAVEEFRSSTSQRPDPDALPGELSIGVYRLEGEGKEAISIPPVEQADGSTMPMTIAAGTDGCRTIRIDYNEAHWQNWSLCPEGRTLMETGGLTFQRWDFGSIVVENLSTFVCDPAVPFVVLDAEPGDVFDRSCTGTNDQIPGSTVSSGKLSVVGIESIDVDGEAIEAMHVRLHNDLTGAQTGTEDLELWFSTTDGLPLRGVRSVTVDSDSPIGTITYTEEGTWQLSSTVPQR